jgi:hypothetical protein
MQEEPQHQVTPTAKNGNTSILEGTILLSQKRERSENTNSKVSSKTPRYAKIQKQFG